MNARPAQIIGNRALQRCQCAGRSTCTQHGRSRSLSQLGAIQGCGCPFGHAATETAELGAGIKGRLVAGLAATAISLSVQPALAKPRLPPLDPDPNRCEKAYTGNTIGQANAVSDKLLDLRQCKYPGKNLSAKVLSGALVSEADFSGATLVEAVLTKAYAVGSNFEGANLTSAVVDRVDFTDANLKGAKFINAVVTGCNFDRADLSGISFEDALVGGEDVKRICLNPTLQGDSRVEIGCRGK